MKISDKTKLDPQKLHKIVLHLSEILRPKTKIPGSFTWFFLITPGNSTLLLIHVIFFSGRAQYWLWSESIWWRKMFLVWCWCFHVNVNMKILFLEQNFNVYVDKETSAPDQNVNVYLDRETSAPDQKDFWPPDNLPSQPILVSSS